MPTINQLLRKARQQPKKKSDAPALKGCPQLKGTVTRVTVVKPKKPNSAERKICRAHLTTGRDVTVYIPGEATGSYVQEHSDILIEGGGPPDLPGVKYTLIPGSKAGSIHGSIGHNNPDQGHPPRHQSRSRYGVKRKDVGLPVGRRRG